MTDATLVTAGPRPAVRDELRANAAGWDECLDRLAGRQADPSGWKVRFDHYAAEFLSALGPQDGQPPGYKG
jgi:hypothetical protein